MLVPLRAVAEHCEGVEVHFRAGGPRLMKEQMPPLLMTEAAEADIVVAQRANSFEGMGVWRRMSTPTTRTVYENDDDIWNITHENKAAYDNYKEGSTAREVVLRLVMTSNLVTVSTPYLGDVTRDLVNGQVPVAVLPNYIPGWVCDLKNDDRQGRMRIGWAGGASHARDILQATGAVRRFMKRNPDWDLFVSGTDYRKEFRCPPERSFHIPWVHVTDYPDVYYRLIDFDIGICPLLDTKFARAKSAVKSLEYMSRGIVPVASDVEPYRRFIEHGVDGFLVKHEHEWLSVLSELAADEEMRLRMSAAARAKARENTIEKHCHEWVDAYRMLFPLGWEFKG
jgi:Glycosyl transferases group 1